MSRSNPDGRSQAGFSLLEAIVALAIVASAGMALFAALNSALDMVGRAERAAAQDSALNNALAWMETVNPMLEPEGRVELGEFELAWSAEPIEPARNAVTWLMAPGLYQVGLYRVELSLSRDGETVAYTYRRVGYRQTREPTAL